MKSGGKIDNFEVCKRSANLCVEIFIAFMNTKEFVFKDQITRSALSIPSSIGE
jgi:four helix bundle protein